MTPRTAPPVELTCSTLASALEQHARLARNALAASCLQSKNAPVMTAPAQVPNGRISAETRGGWELARLEALTDKRDALYPRQALTDPGTPERAVLDAMIDRAEGYVRSAQADVDAIDVSPRARPGRRDVYTVTVPALHVRIEGQAYTADLWRGQVAVNPSTPRYEEYLGRGEHTGHQGRSRWPLYAPRSDGTGLQLARGADDWHKILLAQLWPDALRCLPPLLAVPVGTVTA